VALQLRKHGVKRVRPLAGGLAEWRSLNYPLTSPPLVTIAMADSKSAAR
jgi:3-mercaptopyruvate sulfurtransferase SseA